MKLAGSALEGLLGGSDGATSINGKALNTQRALYTHECSHCVCDTNEVTTTRQEEHTTIQEGAPMGAETPEKDAGWHFNCTPIHGCTG